MAGGIGWLREPTGTGVACAVAAVGLGMFYLAAAGAPVQRMLINGASLAVGLAAFATLVLPRWRLGSAGAAVMPGLGLALLLVALLGTPIEGAARWISLGPLSLQLSLILLPAMIVGFARRPDTAGSTGLTAAALALALQPDRGMAGVLAAGLAALTLLRPSRPAAIALAAAVIAFVVTLGRPDSLPAIAYVDGILFSAFELGPIVGAAVAGGALLLLAPALHREM